MKHTLLLLFFFLFLSDGAGSDLSDSLMAGRDEIKKYLHVPSPEWQDQVIYFIITDLFYDGDTSNNDHGDGEYLAGGEFHFNGGDLKGITEKIGYIKELGATGIWITPPVANQWWNPERTLTGRHGYWASNQMEVDRHFGTLDDYRRLSASLHKNGMYLIQDVVVNHMGDFFTYDGIYDPDDVTRNFRIREVEQPTQYPFYHNDAGNRKDLEMGIYHFTPSISDYTDTSKRRIYQFADLDDLNTSNQLVRDVLKSSFNFWIGQAGVDGFRYDTPIYVEHDFWHDFIHSTDSSAPGVVTYAGTLGKEHFLNYGETALTAEPFRDTITYEVASYLGTEERPEMNSVMNYPLFGTIQRVFAEMQPTNLLTYRLKSNQRIFPHPEYLINLIDDHNGERFLTRGSHESFRQALLFLLTIPGIPVIYYGTEQDFQQGYRQAMFKGGLGSPDRDHFDTESESFRFLQKLINLRKQQKVLTRGKLEILSDSPEGPGVFSYIMRFEKEFAIILFNTSGSRMLAEGIDAGLEPGTVLWPTLSLSSQSDSITVDGQGKLNTFLAPKEGMVLFSKDKTKSSCPGADRYIRIDPLPGYPLVRESVQVRGTSGGVKTLQLLVDGDYRNRVGVRTGEDGTWQAEVPLHYLKNGSHRILACSQHAGSQLLTVSNTCAFELQMEARLHAGTDDPPGDDHGPSGRYQYPAYPSFNKQMDIRSVKALTIGTNLRIELEMAEVTRLWLPPNGFDHVLFNIYIDLPAKTGVRALPLQNALFPGKGSWDYQISASGYTNTMYSSEGATEAHAGAKVGPVPEIYSEEKTITFDISAKSLGYPASLDGCSIYITTWGGTPVSLRPLETQARDWIFGGGTTNDPKIMDDTALITIKLE